MVKLYRVTLPVAPLDKAVRFYRQMLQIEGTAISPTRHYFNCGGTIIVICDFTVEGFAPKRDWKPYENQYVYFAVEDLEATFQRAKKVGANFPREGIKTMPWGERLFYAADPFGNAICFVDEKTIYVAG